MTYPYRTPPAAPSAEKKKSCLLFHDWEINLKPESYDAIIRDSKKIKGRQIYFVDIFEDYNLKCSCCKKEQPMTTNPYYWQLALEDVKKRFKGFDYERSR